MQRPRIFLGFSLIVFCLLTGCASTKWESAIQAFEKQDQHTPPPTHPILFVGSSTIRIWKVNEAFPDLPALNRGFGGSETVDVLYYFDRVIAPYHPQTIVFYSGDNDLAAGKSAAWVVSDTRQLIDRIRTREPQAKLVFIAIKPSVARWNLVGTMRDVNEQNRKRVEARAGDVFIDIGPKLLKPDGKPDADLFRKDGLHLNDKGYAILNEAVKPNLRNGSP
jgi:lysophospholipase L1-like esterase